MNTTQKKKTVSQLCRVHHHETNSNDPWRCKGTAIKVEQGRHLKVKCECSCHEEAA